MAISHFVVEEINAQVPIVCTKFCQVILMKL